ncbi:MAG: alanine racemase, partial [Actinomycetota bacterium]
GLEKAKNLKIEGTFTHLAFADEPKNPVIDEQLDRFEQALAVMTKHGIEPGIRHIANSAATLARSDAHADMVRPGIALYGLAPGPQVPDTDPLKPVLSLKARVVQVKRVQPGEGVSYSHRWHADRETTIASIPLGYADGWPRALTNDARVLIGGKPHPAVGTVTMDSFMVDCGDTPVKVGDEAVLIGTQDDQTLTADELALRLGTINYEIVTRLSQRLPREHRNSA